MGKIHFVGGEKGGVGKSVVSRLIAQFLIDREKPFISLDTDLSHGAMRRFYEEYSIEINLNDFESADKIMESALENETVIVDLAAQSHRPLQRWIEENDFFSLAEENDVVCYFWHVMEDSHDSRVLLGELLDTYGSLCHYVIVKNAVRGGQFSWFADSEEKAAAENLGAKILSLKALHEPTMRKIDQADASFWAAQNLKGSEGALSMMERQRAKVWLKSAYQELDKLGILS